VKAPRLDRVVLAGSFLIAAYCSSAAPPTPGLDVPCAKMGGPVHFDARAEAGAIVLAVTYPKNVGS
jgi:hypothetical protein